MVLTLDIPSSSVECRSSERLQGNPSYFADLFGIPQRPWDERYGREEPESSDTNTTQKTGVSWNRKKDLSIHATTIIRAIFDYRCSHLMNSNKRSFNELKQACQQKATSASGPLHILIVSYRSKCFR
eukprot:GHVH01016173.1.p3 GENE.GHVH01016173.1~~GHVH01016173.1.p3  ORF type:complete len:127 (+),score=9.01 GHVH01016173.1:865-1245(+)